MKYTEPPNENHYSVVLFVTLWCFMMHCGAIVTQWCCLLHCGAVCYNVVPYDALWCLMMHCGAVFCTCAQEAMSEQTNFTRRVEAMLSHKDRRL